MNENSKSVKLIVAGGRDFKGPELFYLMRKSIENFYANEMDDRTLEIVSGKARGADTLALKFASLNYLPVKEFPADWEKFGRSAGYKRNVQMAQYADACICFWDGRSKGTKHMIDISKRMHLPCFIVKYSTSKHFLEELRNEDKFTWYEDLDMRHQAARSDIG